MQALRRGRDALTELLTRECRAALDQIACRRGRARPVVSSSDMLGDARYTLTEGVASVRAAREIRPGRDRRSRRQDDEEHGGQRASHDLFHASSSVTIDAVARQ